MRKQAGKIKNAKLAKRYNRKLMIRKTVIGTAERPRICAVRTNKHISVQVIDDSVSKTLFSLHTFGKQAVAGSGKNIEGAKVIGKAVAEKMKDNKLEKAVFDRNGLRYAGAIAALADAIRKNGIQI